MLINSFHLHIFQKLDKACAQFTDLMLVFLSQHWMDFVMGTMISSNYIDLCLHSAHGPCQACVNRVHTLRGTYGDTYENHSYFRTGSFDPKSLILIWGYGRILWPHSVLE